MTVTELIEKHYWGEHDRDKARQFAIELLEMMKGKVIGSKVDPKKDAALPEFNDGIQHAAEQIDKALEELRK